VVVKAGKILFRESSY